VAYQLCYYCCFIYNTYELKSPASEHNFIHSFNKLAANKTSQDRFSQPLQSNRHVASQRQHNTTPCQPSSQPAFAQEVADAMVEAFGNDVLFGLLSEAGTKTGKKSQNTLIVICVAVLEATDRMQQSDHELPSELFSVMLRLDAFAKTVVALLVPTPGFLNSSARDVYTMTRYRGSQLLEATLKTIIVDNDIWKGKYDELTKKAGSSKVWQPKYAEHLQRLQQVMEPLGDFNSMLTAVVEVFKDYEQMERNMRVGALGDLSACLLTLIPAIAKRILASEAGDDVDVSKLKAFISNICMLSDHDNIQDIQLELDKWQTGSAGKLATRRFGDFLALSVVGGLDNSSSFDLTEFGKLLHGSQHLESSAKDAINSLMPVIITTLKHEASVPRQVTHIYIYIASHVRQSQSLI
jgi:hypothetical protein